MICSYIALSLSQLATYRVLQVPLPQSADFALTNEGKEYANKDHKPYFARYSAFLASCISRRPWLFS